MLRTLVDFDSGRSVMCCILGKMLNHHLSQPILSPQGNKTILYNLENPNLAQGPRVLRR